MSDVDTAGNPCTTRATRQITPVAAKTAIANASDTRIRISSAWPTTPSAATNAAASIGSEVVLWGRSERGSVLAIDDVALAAGTVGYELMCARAPRVPIRAVS